MIRLLVHRFIKDYDNVKDEQVKAGIGKLSGIVGMFCNILLAVFKYTIGTIVHSVSIQADGINNLTDAGSNIVSVVSFHFSSKPADKDHPFGHERLEYLTSLFVGVCILVLGLETAKESIHSILHPSTITFNKISIIVLIFSICIKLWMFSYNTYLSKTYDSSLLKASALDSISDVLGTTGVLLSTILSPVLHFNLDGYMGLVVSCLILFNAYNLLKATCNTLLGEAPDPDLVKEIVLKINSYPIVLGVHDVMVHMYGPSKVFVSAHVEVDGSQDIFYTHECIDTIEREVKKETHAELVLHMDPIKVHDPETEEYKEAVNQAIQAVSHDYSFHDFRIVSGPTHVNLVFDLVVPFDETKSPKEIEDLIQSHLHTKKSTTLVITIDHPFA